MMAYEYSHAVSRTYQYKKITKPLLERKRRARINRCLDELKDLMVDALATEEENISKLEKADILELTVRHLQMLQASRTGGSPVRKGATTTPSARMIAIRRMSMTQAKTLSDKANESNDSHDVNAAESRWQSGFGHCAAEACRFLATLPGETAESLAKHLAAGLQSNLKTIVTTTPMTATTATTTTITTPRPESLRLSPVLATVDLDRTANSMTPRTVDRATDFIDKTVVRERNTPRRQMSSYYEKEADAHCESTTAVDVTATSFQTIRRFPTNGGWVRVNSNVKMKTATKDRWQSSWDQVDYEDDDDDDDEDEEEEERANLDEEEEIDVERVDEGDPMWRPW